MPSYGHFFAMTNRDTGAVQTEASILKTSLRHNWIAVKISKHSEDKTRDPIATTFISDGAGI